MPEVEDLAAGGEVMSEDAERSTTPDIYCDLCLQDNETQHAEGFCIDCNEYLCISCFKAHRKIKMLKFHQLKSKAEMPVTKPAKATDEETCMEHNRILRYYCKSHDQVLCEVCKGADHRTCTDVSKVDSLDKTCSIADKETWLKELDYIDNQFTVSKMILERHKVSVEFYYKQATRRIRQIADGNKEMLQAIETTCNIVEPAIGALRTDISKPDDKRSLFLLKYRVTNQMNALKQRLKSVTIDNKITRYWYITSNSDDRVGFVAKHPFQDYKLQVKTATDTAYCIITALVPFSPTKIIIADQANSKLKVVDTTYNKVSFEIEVNKTPYDLTIIDENTVAMTTGDGREIQVISLLEQMREPKKIERNDFQSCKGIVFNKDSLVVSHSDPNAIQVLELDGKLKYSINLHDRNGPIKTGNIVYLAKSHVAPHLYLSDIASNEVLCVSLDGFVNARFKHDQLSSARGITSGRDGRVFVCCYRSAYTCTISNVLYYTNVMFELNSHLSSGEVILQETDTTAKQSIFYDDMEHKLYVGCRNKDELLVFLV